MELDDKKIIGRVYDGELYAPYGYRNDGRIPRKKPAPVGSKTKELRKIESRRVTRRFNKDAHRKFERSLDKKEDVRELMESMLQSDRDGHTRVTKYTPQLGAEICVRIASGESLNAICKDKHMPNSVSVHNWVLNWNNPYFFAKDLEPLLKDFSEKYRMAREMQAETFVDEIADISGDSSTDYEVRTDKEGNTYRHYNITGVKRSELMIKSRQWIAKSVLTRIQQMDNKNVSLNVEQKPPIPLVIRKD